LAERFERLPQLMRLNVWTDVTDEDVKMFAGVHLVCAARRCRPVHLHFPAEDNAFVHRCQRQLCISVLGELDEGVQVAAGFMYNFAALA
jgi:hypothetical protein